MMKIYTKRGIALAIDDLSYGIFIAALIYLIPFFQKNDLLFYVLLLYPTNMRDFLFKGASLGKKIMGIRIYDKNWKTPSYSVLFRRSHYTSTLYMQKHPHTTTMEDLRNEITILDIIDMEREKFGTRVVDNKVFKRLSEEAKLREGRWEDNMSRMYDEYIMCVYSK